MSGVKDMSWAFSKDRDANGGIEVIDGNTDVLAFGSDPSNDGSTDISKWITSAVTSLESTFSGASSMDADLGTWTTTKVTNMDRTFKAATSFVGTGLDKWSTGLVTTLSHTFFHAGEMNANVGNWITASVVDMKNTFMNAAKFEGNGLNKWNANSVTNMAAAFDGTALTSCNKRKVVNAWASISEFSTYAAAWTSDTCNCVSGQQIGDPASCAACDAGKYSTVVDAPSCTPHTTPSCPAGQGSVPGSATADTSCPACSAGKYSDEVDQSACKDKSVVDCPQGVGYTEGAPTSDSASCSSCVPGQYNDKKDTSACIPKTVTGVEMEFTMSRPPCVLFIYIPLGEAWHATIEIHINDDTHRVQLQPYSVRLYTWCSHTDVLIRFSFFSSLPSLQLVARALAMSKVWPPPTVRLVPHVAPASTATTPTTQRASPIRVHSAPPVKA